jgi:ABC-2 type transport system permease protein
MTTFTSTGMTSAPADVVARRTPFSRLTVIELRKAVDTHAGLVMLLLIAGTTVAAIGYTLVTGTGQPVAFGHVLNRAVFGAMLFLPVIGVLSMTGEWTQRTALATFTLAPRRGRVLAAKILAVLALAVTVVLVVAALAAVATLAGATLAGAGSNWTGAGRDLSGELVTAAVNVAQGLAFGALLQHTAAALVLYFVTPMIWSAVTTAGLLTEGVARWLDLPAAFAALGALDPGAVFDPPVLVALAVWIGLPLAAGVARGLRRDIT